MSIVQAIVLDYPGAMEEAGPVVDAVIAPSLKRRLAQEHDSPPDDDDGSGSDGDDDDDDSYAGPGPLLKRLRPSTCDYRHYSTDGWRPCPRHAVVRTPTGHAVCQEHACACGSKMENGRASCQSCRKGRKRIHCQDHDGPS